MRPVTQLSELQTPALVVESADLEHNLRSMSEARPGAGLRPHVKAHKCARLAARQAELGHRSFTCATIREVEGLAAAGLGEDLLLANEVLDAVSQQVGTGAFNELHIRQLVLQREFLDT